MHRYKQIEYKAGATIEIIKCIPKQHREDWKGVRQARRKKTKEEMDEANLRQAARKLTRKINANFRPGDWHLILTYRKDARPEPEEAKKQLKDFISGAREIYKKNGFALKYIHTTEYLNKGIHHHIIINNINTGKLTTADIVRKLWKGKGNPKFVPLYDNGEYKQLADYFIKETRKTRKDNPHKQSYSCSRNLIIPQPEKRIRKVKKTWDMDPRPRKGYYIDQDTLYNGTDKLGYPYQRYVMVKIDPTEEDWSPASWPDEGGNMKQCMR